MKEYKKYVAGGLFMCFMVFVLIASTEKTEAFWPFSKAKKENNVNYTGAAMNTESDKTAPIAEITVISPNGGEILKGGKNFNIKWRSKNIQKDGVWNITIAKKETGLSIDIARNIDVRKNNYVWKIPTSFGGEYKISLSCTIKGSDSACSGKSRDESDGFFIIAQKAKKFGVTVVSPNGGEEFGQGGDVIVHWESSGAKYVNFSLIDSIGNVFNTTGTAAIKPPFVWTLPIDLKEGPYKIKIDLFRLDEREVPVLVAEDESDGYFFVFGPQS